MNATLRFLVGVVAFAAGTWMVGWWMVPVIALVLGALRTRPIVVAASAAVAWLVLMLIDAAGGDIGKLSALLAGVMGLPAAALFAVTLLFPAVTAWSAASLGDAARSIRATSRRPS